MIEATRETAREEASGPSWLGNAIALAILSFVALGAYLVMYNITDDKAAASFSSMVLAAIYPQIDQSLKHKTLRFGRPTWPKDIVPLESFVIPWYRMLLYGVLIIVGLAGITGLFVDIFLPVFLMHWLHVPTDWVINWLYVHFSSAQMPPQLSSQINAPDAVKVNGVFIGYVVVPSILYFLGSWIGSRCNRFGVFVVIVVVMLAGYIDLAQTFLILPETKFETLFHGEGKSFELFLTLALARFGQILWQVLFGLVGFRHGRRKQMASYLRYLLSRLSSTDREAMIDMAYEAAKEKSPT
jgi:hypothetical protein